MKLFIISQKENSGYDTYDSAVVAAPDEQTAKKMSPGNGRLWEPGDDFQSDWCSSHDKVTVKYIGDAVEETEQGIICSSFNAG